MGTAIAGYLDVTGVSNSPLWEYQFVNDFLGTVPHRQGLTTEWVGVNPDMRRAGNTASSPSEDIHGTSLRTPRTHCFQAMCLPESPPIRMTCSVFVLHRVWRTCFHATARPYYYRICSSNQSERTNASWVLSHPHERSTAATV